MDNIFSALIHKELGLRPQQVENTIKLLDDGATVPFISRYRKEATGNLDEVQIGNIAQSYTKLKETAARKETIIKTIEEQGKLTPELRSEIDNTWDPTRLEDLYQPYKPKRKTRATKAREAGLEPLALALMSGSAADLEAAATKFLTDDVPTTDDALQGARDIIAEWVADQPETREAARNVFRRDGVVSTKLTKGKEAEGEKYRDYIDRSENLARCPSHRLLAMMRAEREGVLKLSVAPTEPERITDRLCRKYARCPKTATQVEMAISDSYKRLIAPAMETEMETEAKEKADTEAIKVFETNLRQLLLAAPLGRHRTLALDPGFRTGCKVVCLDEQGQMLCHSVIFPHPPHAKVAEAQAELRRLIDLYDIEAVAIGNGTASRETETFVRDFDKEKRLRIFVVSEDGASIYSASATAREEFPDEDVTVRGAVSIGRRLMDPLAELVKIDPKSLGIGQYQHDVDQARLKQSLDSVVVSCVNQVGVELNTASRHLLTYVSGLGPTLAKNIVDYRAANGPFSSRAELKKVPRLGPKAFEQCAGFLRISGAKNPLDASAVHPERYDLVKQMAADAGCTVVDLMKDKDKRASVDLSKYVKGDVGLPTLHDIMSELEKPGRDPRDTIKDFSFDESVHSIEDLRAGMELPGIVTNITAFGAFVDLGVHTDGLVHISQLADKFVKNVSDVVSLHQHVIVRVLDVDTARGRINLSMKGF
ncbi:MAG: Tex family protein [Marinilabiliaceae bacterium]